MGVLSGLATPQLTHASNSGSNSLLQRILAQVECNNGLQLSITICFQAPLWECNTA